MPNNQFDALTPEQQEFLISYTKHRGFLHNVIEELAIPGNNGWETHYNANKILLDVQRVLGVPDKNYENYIPTWPYTSIQHPKASDVVCAEYHHNKLSHGFNAPLTCYPPTNDYSYIEAYCYDEEIMCYKAHRSSKPERVHEFYRYEVLDMIVELLIDNMGSAQKGSQSGKNAYANGTIAGYYKTHCLDNSPVKSSEGRLSIYYSILQAAHIITVDKNTISLTPEYWALV